MLKQITVLFLIAAISLQSFNKAVIYIGYAGNTAAFSRNCENKSQPVMHCNGKCQMMKKMHEQEKKDSQAPTRKLTVEDAISSKSWFFCTIRCACQEKPSHQLFIVRTAPGITRSHFHPPLV